MTQHDTSVYFRHMLDYAREAVKFARGKTRDDLEDDRLLQLALVRFNESPFLRTSVLDFRPRLGYNSSVVLTWERFSTVIDHFPATF
jgi:hypothetical protein